MAWSFVNAGARAANNNTSSTTAAVPAGISQDDLLVIICYGRGAAPTPSRSPGLPAGWSEAARHEDSDGSFGRIACFYKVAGASESNVTVTWGAGGATGSTEITVMLAFRGNDTSSPLGDVGADSSWAAIQNIGPVTAVTLTTASQLLLVIAGRQQDMGTNGDSAVVDVLSGDSQTWAEAVEFGSTTGTDAGLVIDYAFTSGTPAITDKTFTNGNVQTAAGAGFMVAFKIAAVVASLLPLSRQRAFAGLIVR